MIKGLILGLISIFVFSGVALACEKPIDVCNNIEGNQAVVPEGDQLNDDGSCTPKIVDVCPNIDEVQQEIPQGMELNSDSQCVEIPPVIVVPVATPSATPSAKPADPTLATLPSTGADILMFVLGPAGVVGGAGLKFLARKG